MSYENRLREGCGVMDCACSCYVDHGVDHGPALFSECIRKARKPHVCCECKRVIRPGEKYEDVKGLWDEGFESYKTCLGCSRLRDSICYGFYYGELDSVVWDCFGVSIIGEAE